MTHVYVVQGQVAVVAGTAVGDDEVKYVKTVRPDAHQYQVGFMWNQS